MQPTVMEWGGGAGMQYDLCKSYAGSGWTSNGTTVDAGVSESSADGHAETSDVSSSNGEWDAASDKQVLSGNVPEYSLEQYACECMQPGLCDEVAH